MCVGGSELVSFMLYLKIEPEDLLTEQILGVGERNQARTTARN